MVLRRCAYLHFLLFALFLVIVLIGDLGTAPHAYARGCALLQIWMSALAGICVYAFPVAFFLFPFFPSRWAAQHRGLHNGMKRPMVRTQMLVRFVCLIMSSMHTLIFFRGVVLAGDTWGNVDLPRRHSWGKTNCMSFLFNLPLLLLMYSCCNSCRAGIGNA